MIKSKQSSFVNCDYIPEKQRATNEFSLSSRSLQCAHILLLIIIVGVVVVDVALPLFFLWDFVVYFVLSQLPVWLQH